MSSLRKRGSLFFFSPGQPIFLHAVNIQMLVRQFGSFENCPKVIRGKILEKDSTSMTHELRNKLRYLKHLPTTSTFEVCELDMNVPRFSLDVVNEFKTQLDARRKKRQRRAREEKRRDTAIAIEMDKQLGKYPDPKVRIESNFHFPQFGSSQPLARSSESLASIDSTLSTSPYAGGHHDNSSMSFAKMLRQGVAKPAQSALHRSGTYPTLGAARPCNTSGHDSDQGENAFNFVDKNNP